MSILIIDDDQDLCRLFSACMRSEGFRILCTATGADGLHALSSFAPNLVVLDVGLPDADGRDICRQIRSLSSVPVLMMSAYALTTDDIVRGLEDGADDYLVKPVHPARLRAQVRAMLRRCSTPEPGDASPAYADLYLEVDITHRVVRLRGAQVSLSPLAFSLLEILVRNANQTVPSLEIVESLWPAAIDDGAYSGYVRTYVKRLRNLIEPDPANPRYIVSDYGLGYRFMTQAACTQVVHEVGVDYG